MKSKEIVLEIRDGDKGAYSWGDDDDDLGWTAKEWIKIVKTLRRDCKPYLSKNKGNILYRGINNPEIVMKKKVRLTDREPKDMPQDIHDMLNKYFTMKYGAEFRNALFLSGDATQAENYGNLFRIFPIGKFEFLWSPKVGDLFLEWETYATKWTEEDGYSKTELKRFHDNVLKNGYTTKYIAKAIVSGNEIMLRCGSYYAINDEAIDELPIKWQEMLE